VSSGAAGKTSILHRLLTGTRGPVRHTLGLNKETVKVKGYPPVTSMVYSHRPTLHLFDVRSVLCSLGDWYGPYD